MMLRNLIHTRDELAPALARIVLGLVMLPHGAQKVLGWFGGYGFEGTMGYFTGTLHVPALLGVAAILAESAGAVALVTGFAGRLGALGIAANMLAATLLVHLPNGFFMNWFGTQRGEGFEYQVLALALAAIVLVRGSGAASVDLALTRGRAPRPALAS